MTYLKSLKTTEKLPFSIIQVIPGTVIGPSELINSATEAEAHMDRMSRALLFNDPKPRYAFGFVHIDDCAGVHIESLDEEKVPESDIPDWFIAAACSEKGKDGRELWKEVGDALEKTFEEEVKKKRFTIGRTNVPINMPFYVDSTLTKTMLLGGAKFRRFAESVKEVGSWYVKLADLNNFKRESTS